MKKWQKGINLTLSKEAQCSGNFTGLAPLLDRCKSKKDVYHSGFKEYVRTLPGGHSSLPWQQAVAQIAPQKNNANPG